jgi:hypothetical protein
VNRNSLLRLSLVAFLLGVLYFQGASLFLIGFLALFFAVVFLLRGKNWPGFARWAVVFLIFLAAYYVFKFIVYALLSSVGFDVQGEMARALNSTG